MAFCQLRDRDGWLQQPAADSAAALCLSTIAQMTQMEHLIYVTGAMCHVDMPRGRGVDAPCWPQRYGSRETLLSVTCLSADPYHMAGSGTCFRTNDLCCQRLSVDPYHMRGSGTCLRTNSSSARPVCPRTRTTWAAKRCGTGLRTEQIPIPSLFVLRPVSHVLGERVVRVCGQTAP